MASGPVKQPVTEASGLAPRCLKMNTHTNYTVIILCSLVPAMSSDMVYRRRMRPGRRDDMQNVKPPKAWAHVLYVIREQWSALLARPGQMQDRSEKSKTWLHCGWL